MRFGPAHPGNGQIRVATTGLQDGRRREPGTGNLSTATQRAFRAILPTKVSRRRARVQQDGVQQEERQDSSLPQQQTGSRRRFAAFSILGQDPRVSAGGDGRGAGPVPSQQAEGKGRPERLRAGLVYGFVAHTRNKRGDEVYGPPRTLNKRNRCVLLATSRECRWSLTPSRWSGREWCQWRNSLMS